MNIGITGATGFLGRYIVNRLLGEGHDCRCWHRAGSDRGGFETAGPGKLAWIEGTLNDDAAAKALAEGADAIVHAALDRPGAGERPSARRAPMAPSRRAPTIRALWCPKCL